MPLHRILSSVAAAMVLTALPACKTAESVGSERATLASGAVEVRELSHGTCALPAREQMVVRDAGTWKMIWAQIQGTADAEASLPVVDFDSELVVVMSQGQQVSGGFDIEITGVEDTGTELLIRARERIPGPYCMVTMALTHPYHAVAVPRRERTVVFPAPPSEEALAAVRPSGQSHTGRINPDVYCVFKARKSARVSVLVGLNKIDGDDHAKAELVSSVIEALGDDFEVINRLDFATAFSGKATALGIARLADDPRVSKVDPECDGPVVIELDH